MPIPLVLFGVFMILAGLFNVFGREIVWRGQETVNRWRGTASERTPQWEMGQGMLSLVAIVGGVAVLFLGLTSLLQTMDDNSLAGAYTCTTPDDEFPFREDTLWLKGDGTGTYDEKPLVWAAPDGDQSSLSFSGSSEVASGSLNPTYDWIDITLQDDQRLICKPNS